MAGEDDAEACRSRIGDGKGDGDGDGDGEFSNDDVRQVIKTGW